MCCASTKGKDSCKDSCLVRTMILTISFNRNRHSPERFHNSLTPLISTRSSIRKMAFIIPKVRTVYKTSQKRKGSVEEQSQGQ